MLYPVNGRVLRRKKKANKKEAFPYREFRGVLYLSTTFKSTKKIS
jgi:hypothetical protein